MPLQTTGIGSVPFAEMAPANAHIAAGYSLVFVPQLARGDGDGGMLNLVLPPTLNRRALSGFGVALTDFLEGPEIAGAFEALADVTETVALQDAREFAQERSGMAPLPRLKAQMMGPVSLLQTLRDAGSRPLWSAAALHPKVLDWSIKLAHAMISVLQPLCNRLDLWIDEPMLGLMVAADERAAAGQLLRAWQDAVKDKGVETGLHCCSEPPFDLLDVLAPSTFSFDLLRFEDETRTNSRTLGRFLNRGGCAALGVIAPLSFESDPDPLPMVRDLAGTLGIETPAKMMDTLVLTPTCGTMLTPQEREEEIAERLSTWARTVTESIEES